MRKFIFSLIHFVICIILLGPIFLILPVAGFVISGSWASGSLEGLVFWGIFIILCLVLLLRIFWGLFLFYRSYFSKIGEFSNSKVFLGLFHSIYPKAATPGIAAATLSPFLLINVLFILIMLNKYTHFLDYISYLFEYVFPEWIIFLKRYRI